MHLRIALNLVTFVGGCKMFRPTLKNLLLLAFVGVLTGFILGTGILLGPVQWIAGLARSRYWSIHTEESLVRACIVVLGLATFVISLLVTATIIRSDRKHIKLGIPLLFVISFAATLHMWLTPGMVNPPDILAEEDDYQFTIGSYPDKARLHELKRRGYTTVISLLHPAVVPFEPKLLADEQRLIKEVGLEFLHLPMLPWISENEETLNELKALAREGQGRYYIHCYLGKDRVSIARLAIEQAGGSTSPGSVRRMRRHRSLTERKELERGKIFVPDKGVYVMPYPTDEEYLAVIVADDIRNVVNLLDSERLTIEEAKLLRQYQINYQGYPISSLPYEPAQALRAAQAVWRMPRPVIVHGFKSPSFRTQAFIQAFMSNRAPLPPGLFIKPLRVGKVEIIAPHIAVGLRPTSLRAWSELHKHGIRRFLFLGDPDSEEARRDSEFTAVAEFDWHVLKPRRRSTLVETLHQGGPWYVYGPGVPDARDRIIREFGPAIPAGVQFDPATILDVTAEEEGEVAPIPKYVPKGLAERVRYFVDRAIPSVKLAVLLIPFSFFYAGLAGAYVGWLKTRKKVRTAYTRKIFHLFIFTMAGFLQWSSGLAAVMIFGSVTALCVLYAVARGKDFPFYEAMARPSDEPHKTFYILVPLVTTAVGGVISNLFFMQFAYIGYLVGGWGDAIGEPVGSRWGRHKYRVPSALGVPATRSIEGSLSVFLVSFAVALLAVFVGGAPMILAIKCAVACALAGTIVEAISTHGFDNLTIQVAAAGVASLVLGG